MSELTDAYSAYWAKRKAVKQADRDSLDARLTPERERLARAIRQEQVAGRNVTELQEEVGSNNRNFLYSILKGVPYVNSYANPAAHTGAASEPATQDNVFPLTYEQEWLDDMGLTVLITVHNSSDNSKKEYTIKRDYFPDTNDYAVVGKTIPKEWLDTPAGSDGIRDFYRTILVKLRENS